MFKNGKKNREEQDSNISKLVTDIGNLTNRYILLMQSLLQRNLIDKDFFDAIAAEMQSIYSSAEQIGELEQNYVPEVSIARDIEHKNYLISLRLVKFQIKQRLDDWKLVIEKFNKSKSESGEDISIRVYENRLKEGTNKEYKKE